MTTRNDHPETMLYRSPGPHEWEGFAYEFIVVPSADVDAKLAEGWFLTIPEAHAAAQGETAKRLEANETELANVTQQIEQVGQSYTTLKAVHKGRGVWDVQDAGGNTVHSGLTKEEAQRLAG